MKKTMKKTIALILTVLLIIPLISVQGFALFDKITDVKINSIDKFSWKQIKQEIEFLEEMGGAETEDAYHYMLGCDADVTLSTGEVIKVNDLIGISKDEKRFVYAYAYVDIRECQKAHKSGNNKVTVHIEVSLSSSIGITLDTRKIETEKTFPEKIIKKLSLSSGKIVGYETEDMYISGNMEGIAFNIVYGDGTKKTAKVKTAADGAYTLDGEQIFIDVDYSLNKQGKLYATVIYYDYETRIAATAKDFPVKKVKINSVTFDDNFNEKTLKYTVTKANGKTVKGTYKFGEPVLRTNIGGMQIAYYGNVEIEGVNMSVNVVLTEGETYPPKQTKEVTLMFDDGTTATKKIDGPQEEGTVLGEIIFKIKQLIEKIFAVLPVTVL